MYVTNLTYIELSSELTFITLNKITLNNYN